MSTTVQRVGGPIQPNDQMWELSSKARELSKWAIAVSSIAVTILGVAGAVGVLGLAIDKTGFFVYGLVKPIVAWPLSFLASHPIIATVLAVVTIAGLYFANAFQDKTLAAVQTFKELCQMETFDEKLRNGDGELDIDHLAEDFSRQTITDWNYDQGGDTFWSYEKRRAVPVIRGCLAANQQVLWHVSHLLSQVPTDEMVEVRKAFAPLAAETQQIARSGDFGSLSFSQVEPLIPRLQALTRGVERLIRLATAECDKLEADVTTYKSYVLPEVADLVRRASNAFRKGDNSNGSSSSTRRSAQASGNERRGERASSSRYREEPLVEWDRDADRSGLGVVGSPAGPPPSVRPVQAYSSPSRAAAASAATTGGADPLPWLRRRAQEQDSAASGGGLGAAADGSTTTTYEWPTAARVQPPAGLVVPGGDQPAAPWPADGEPVPATYWAPPAQAAPSTPPPRFAPAPSVWSPPTGTPGELWRAGLGGRSPDPTQFGATPYGARQGSYQPPAQD